MPCADSNARMEPTARRMEIFAPFEAAVKLTKLILFQPFDFTKWLVIGFAAFLASLGGGGWDGLIFRRAWEQRLEFPCRRRRR